MSSTDDFDAVMAQVAPEDKDRVYKMLHEWDISPDDAVFELFVALGWFKTFFEDAPARIEDVFTEHEGKLNTWSQLHLDALTRIASHLAVCHDLIDVQHELRDSSTTLTSSARDLSADLRQAISVYNAMEAQQKTMTESLKAMAESHIAYNKQLEIVSKEVARLSQQQLGIGHLPQRRGVSWFLLVALAGSVCLSAFTLWRVENLHNSLYFGVADVLCEISPSKEGCE